MDAETVIEEERRISDLYAPHYRNNTLTNSYPYQLERQRFADWVIATATSAGIDPAAARVLDVGCGTGDILQLLQTRGMRRLLGVDVAAGMISEAQRNLPDAKFFLEQIDRLEDVGEPVQIITAAFTVHHLQRPRSFFELIDRVLEPGGWFFILEYNRASWSRRPILGDLLLAPTIPARALLKMKNRGLLSTLSKVPALFNPAHRLLTFSELLAAVPEPSAYDIRVTTHGLWLAALKHSLSGESRFDRGLVRTIDSLERRLVPAGAGHFQWIAGRRRTAGDPPHLDQ